MSWPTEDVAADDDAEEWGLEAAAQARRARSRRSTWAGVGGVLAIALGLLLTVTHTGGLVLPTVLGIAGVGSLMAGVIGGALLVADNVRFGRPPSRGD